jgi:hypothetical protein
MKDERERNADEVHECTDNDLNYVKTEDDRANFLHPAYRVISMTYNGKQNLPT